MGDSLHYQRVQLHAAKRYQYNIPFIRIMLSWISDILDKQIHLIEAQGAWVIIPILGINSFFVAWFADIHVWQDTFDLIKNISLSLIGVSMGAMGVVNTYIGMRNRIKKYKQENKSDKKKSA